MQLILFFNICLEYEMHNIGHEYVYDETIFY
jgi:hypothetical protein